MKIKYYLHSYQTKRREYLLNCNIFTGGTPGQITVSTKIRVQKHRWDVSNQRLKGSSPRTDHLNAIINNHKSKVMDAVTSYKEENKTEAFNFKTSKELRRKIHGIALQDITPIYDNLNSIILPKRRK